jgi:hypothetical protein
MSKKRTSSKNSKGVASNRDSSGRFLKGTHWRKPQAFRERAYLEAEYINKKRSTSDIAAEFGVTDGAVLFWLHKHKIERRTVAQARKFKRWGLAGKANGMYGRCGAKNPRWIDGSSPLRQTMYARSFWKELAKAVYERDGYKCVRCGHKHARGRKLHAHHVRPWSGNPDARFSLSNIITLCEVCHTWVHSKANVKNEYLA